MTQTIGKPTVLIACKIGVSSTIKTPFPISDYIIFLDILQDLVYNVGKEIYQNE